MGTPDKAFTDRVRRALGSSRVVPLAGLPSGGPLDLLQLRAEVQRRFQSSGGRPTDPEWDISRMVRFKREHWKTLETMAETLSREGRKVSAGQLAAMLLERSMGEAKRAVEDAVPVNGVMLWERPMVPRAASLRVDNVKVMVHRGR